MTTTPLKLEYTRPALYPKQEAAVFDLARWCYIEASTKSGKTVGCIVWLTELALYGTEGQNFWWVAPVYSQAKIAYRRTKRGLPRQLYTSNETELTITLFNGAVMWFKSADNPDNLYGEDVYGLVIDEASRCKAEAWTACVTTITATGGPVRIIGNVKGRKNWAYQMARRAEAGERDSAYHRITAQDAIDAGVLSWEGVEDARSKLPDNVAGELFDAIASDDEGNPFNGLAGDAISRCYGVLHSEREPVCWGWDLAKYNDWTVGIALDHLGDVCRFERFQRPWEETTETIASLVGSTKAVIDATGVGDPIVERLIRKLGNNVEAYVLTGPSKQRLMEGLAVVIQSQDISYPEGVISQELESFEYEYTRTGVKYSAPEGMWDDCVTALGLVVSGCTFGARSSEVIVPSYRGDLTHGVAQDVY